MRQAFTKIAIHGNFDWKCHIQIKIKAFDYIINRVLSYLILDNLNKWHLVTYLLKKIILAKMECKIHNNELLTVIKVFKVCGHFFINCKHKVLILTNHNKFY